MKTYQSLFPKCLWSGRLLSFSRLLKHFSSHHCKSTTVRNTSSRDSIIFSVKTEKHLTAFESSFVGHICGKHKKEDDTSVRKDLRLTMKDNEFYEIEKETPPLKDSILRNDCGIDCSCPFFKTEHPPFKVGESWDYLVSTIFFIIMNVRAVSFPGWALPWYQWTFYYVDKENGASYISTCMDIFGLTFFMSLPFSFLPQLIIWICGKIGNIQKGESHVGTILKSFLRTISPT